MSLCILRKAVGSFEIILYHIQNINFDDFVNTVVFLFTP